MRYALLLLLAFSLFSCTAQNDWSRDKLKGNVKQVSHYTIDYRNLSKTNISLTLYQKQGLKIKKQWFVNNPDSAIKIELYSHKDNKRNQLSVQIVNGITNRITLYYYNHSGFLTNSTSSYPGLSHLDQELLFYDNQSRLTQRIVIVSNETLLRKTYRYSQQGRIDIMTSTIAEVMKVLWRHYYNQQGQLSLIISDQQKIEMLYNTQSQLSQETRLLPNGITLYKKNFYYDSKGNISSIKEYDSISNQWFLIKEHILDIKYYK